MLYLWFTVSFLIPNALTNLTELNLIVKHYWFLWILFYSILIRSIKIHFIPFQLHHNSSPSNSLPAWSILSCLAFSLVLSPFSGRFSGVVKFSLTHRCLSQLYMCSRSHINNHLIIAGPQLMTLAWLHTISWLYMARKYTSALYWRSDWTLKQTNSRPSSE